jgi:hypothetical protein
MTWRANGAAMGIRVLSSLRVISFQLLYAWDSYRQFGGQPTVVPGARHPERIGVPDFCPVSAGGWLQLLVRPSFGTRFLFFLETALDPLRYVCTVIGNASIDRARCDNSSRFCENPRLSVVWKIGAMSNVPQSDCTPRDSRGRLMQQLRRQLGRWEATAPAEDAEIFSSGAAAIDRLLPGGGLRHGMLVEWLGGEWSRGVEEQWSRKAKQNKNYSTTPLLHYSSVCTLSLLAAREACREGGALVVIDQQQTFYPPAAAAWGIDLDRLIVVRPRSARDELWAAVQSLRSPAVAAVWGMIDQLDGRAFRRLQLGAQAGRTLGLLLRPPSARGQPSWADVRIEVKGKLQNANCKMQIANWRASAIENLQFRAPPAGWSCNLHSPASPNTSRRIQVQVLRVRNGRPGSKVTQAIDDTTHTVREMNPNYDTHPLPVARELADPADRSFPARA